MDHLLDVGGNGRTKMKKRRRKRMILTRNNPFDIDGDLKMNENEVWERNELKTKNIFENLTVEERNEFIFVRVECKGSKNHTGMLISISLKKMGG